MLSKIRMQKSRQPQKPAPQPPKTLSVHEAVLNLATRLKQLEGATKEHMISIEHKFGEYETSNTAPDMDLITDMFKAQNDKMDRLAQRVAELENQTGVKPVKVKGGTVKLNSISLKEDGISFDTEN